MYAYKKTPVNRAFSRFRRRFRHNQLFPSNRPSIRFRIVSSLVPGGKQNCGIFGWMVLDRIHDFRDIVTPKRIATSFPSADMTASKSQPLLSSSECGVKRVNAAIRPSSRIRCRMCSTSSSNSLPCEARRRARRSPKSFIACLFLNGNRQTSFVPMSALCILGFRVVSSRVARMFRREMIY